MQVSYVHFLRLDLHLTLDISYQHLYHDPAMMLVVG